MVFGEGSFADEEAESVLEEGDALEACLNGRGLVGIGEGGKAERRKAQRRKAEDGQERDGRAFHVG